MRVGANQRGLIPFIDVHPIEYYSVRYLIGSESWVHYDHDASEATDGRTTGAPVNISIVLAVLGPVGAVEI